jgi:signal peptidase I
MSQSNSDLPPPDFYPGKEPDPFEEAVPPRSGEGEGPAGGDAGGGRPAREGERQGRDHWIGVALELAVLFMIALVLAIYLQAFIIKPYVIPSPSMEPTLQEGDRVLVNRTAFYFGGEPHKGDVIVFRFNPNDTANWTKGGNVFTRSLDLLAEVLNITHQESLPFIKRVVGEAGDIVELKEGQLYINGEIYEPDYEYVKDAANGKWEVPEGCVMVMGDNRPNSNDSRRWGFVPYEAIIGKAVVIWWPPSRWTTL